MSLDRRNAASVLLLAFVAVTALVFGVKEFRHARAVAAAEAAVPRPAAPAVEGSTIVVSYFHTTARCASCLRIEDLTASTVTERFMVPVADRRLVWRVVNVDDPGNSHYMKDYQLYTKSVVVSEVRGGKEVRWKNLDRVWTLLDQPEAFQEYVEKEVRSFLGPA